MSEEEKYDELIRQKFAEKEFMFNEANWEKAEAMIDSSRKTKKVFRWSVVFLIGLITGIFLMFPLIKNNPSQSSAEHKKSADSSMVTDRLSTQPATENKEIADHVKSSINSSRGADESPVTKNETLSTKNKAHNIVLPDQLQKNKFSTVSGVSDSNNAQYQPESKVTSDVGRNSKKNKQASEADQDHFQNAESNKKRLVQQNKKGNNPSGNEKDAFALLNETAKSSTLKKKKDAKEEVKEGKAIADNKENEAKTKFAKKDLSAAETMDSTLVENKAAEEIAAKIDALNDSTKQEEKKLAVADSVQKSDSAKAVSQDKSITPALDGPANVTFLSIDAGINGQLGWKNNGITEARGLTPVIGLGITHAFNQTWSVCAGVHYNGIGYLKGDSKTSSFTTYDFGSTTTIITTKPRFLHYISIPLAIQYHFNDKNAILAGGSLSYLLNAKSKVEEHVTYVRPIDSLSAAQSSNSDYYAKTFNVFDAAVSIGYRRKISSHFSIAAIANFGLLDIKPNSFFLQNTFERNSGLKVILSYNLFNL
jgi:hypothetical protein